MVEWALLRSVREVSREAWDTLVGEGSPFLEWDWLATLEEAGAVGGRSGWSPRPLVAREDGRLVVACPLYAKANSEGEFVFDHAWADAAIRAGIEYYPKLVVGVPFTPVGGARILTASGLERKAWTQRAGVALRESCLASGLSGVHVNFCREDEVDGLRAAGFLPRIGLQYHWRNHGYRSFEDYLARLRSKRRNQVRRERRAVRSQGLDVETLLGDAIPDALFPRLSELYRSTVDKYFWGRRYLNARFFELLRERFRHRLCVVVARRGRDVVGATLNVQKRDALYGRYWGCFEEVRHLHFEVCYYAAIEHCIQAGLQRFEPGAGGEYKQVRGFDAQRTWSLHFLADPRLHRAVAEALDHERARYGEALEWLREHSALKPSPQSAAAACGVEPGH